MSCEQERNRKYIVCPTNTCEDIAVSVPVEIRAHADVGDIVLRCMGHHIESDSDRRSCNRFKIVQKVHACIPVKYCVECEVHDEYVDFDTNRRDDNC